MLATWAASRVDRVVLVVHPQDTQIVAPGAAAGAHVVQPSIAPSEMKDLGAVGAGLYFRVVPQPTDAWLLAPADMPALEATTIDVPSRPMNRAWLPIPPPLRESGRLAMTAVAGTPCCSPGPCRRKQPS